MSRRPNLCWQAVKGCCPYLKILSCNQMVHKSIACSHAKWSWKPNISNLLKKLGHRLSLFNCIFDMLDNRTRIAFYNGLVLPHLDYADTVWADQPGLKSEMEKLQSFQTNFARKIKLGKMSSSEALKCLNWLPLAGRRLSHRCSAVENAIKGNIPQHFESFKSTLRSSHGYNACGGSSCICGAHPILLSI